MDKTIWAKRKLDSILKINPYHYQSLLLMADIKSSKNRTDEAKEYILKAIDSNSELPDGYAKFGQIFLKEFKKTDNIEYYNAAVEEFNKALSIQPENLLANRSLGYLSLLQNNYDEAIKYFKKILSAFPNNKISLYNLAIAYEKDQKTDKSLNCFIKILKVSPSDSLVLSRLEDFLVLNDFALGHPLRVKFSNGHFETALDKLKKNLSIESIMHLQRSLLLNPMNKTSRESLRDSYYTLNYYRLYINELKILNRIYPEDKYQDKLNVAIIKRRDRLYHISGYSDEAPPRDVPKILVLNFWPRYEVTPHPDAGEVIANYLTFVLAQFGRVQPIGIRNRLKISQNLKDDQKFLGDNLEILGEMVKAGKIEGLDYIVFGSFREVSNYISMSFELLDFHTGAVIGNFSISENGKNYIPSLSLRASKKLFNIISFKGRILKINNDTVIVNIGLFDGIKPGDLLVIYKLKSPLNEKRLNVKKKIIFIVNESDTLISSAKPLKSVDIQLVDINDTIYPLEKRRSKLIK